jgi:hypothetical protein
MGFVSLNSRAAKPGRALRPQSDLVMGLVLSIEKAAGGVVQHDEWI